MLDPGEPAHTGFGAGARGGVLQAGRQAKVELQQAAWQDTADACLLSHLRTVCLPRILLHHLASLTSLPRGDTLHKTYTSLLVVLPICYSTHLNWTKSEVWGHN